MLLAVVNPDNTPHGYNWTFGFPMILFIVIAGGLYLLFSRPHQVPGHGMLAAARARGAARTPTPEPEAARGAAVASGFTTAEGGGAAESEAEPIGAHLTAGQEAESGSVTAGEETGADVSDPEDGAAPADSDPEAGE